MSVDEAINSLVVEPTGFHGLMVSGAGCPVGEMLVPDPDDPAIPVWNVRVTVGISGGPGQLEPGPVGFAGPGSPVTARPAINADGEWSTRLQVHPSQFEPPFYVNALCRSNSELQPLLTYTSVRIVAGPGPRNLLVVDESTNPE